GESPSWRAITPIDGSAPAGASSSRTSSTSWDVASQHRKVPGIEGLDATRVEEVRVLRQVPAVRLGRGLQPRPERALVDGSPQHRDDERRIRADVKPRAGGDVAADRPLDKLSGGHLLHFKTPTTTVCERTRAVSRIAHRAKDRGPGSGGPHSDSCR